MENLLGSFFKQIQVRPVRESSFRAFEQELLLSSPLSFLPLPRCGGAAEGENYVWLDAFYKFSRQTTNSAGRIETRGIPLYYSGFTSTYFTSQHCTISIYPFIFLIINNHRNRHELMPLFNIKSRMFPQICVNYLYFIESKVVITFPNAVTCRMHNKP